MYLCMHACMHASIHVCMNVWCMHACMYARALFYGIWAILLNNGSRVTHALEILSLCYLNFLPETVNLFRIFCDKDSKL